MKKILAILMLLALCLGLCACGGEEVALPTKPAQSTPQNMPVAQEIQSSASGEVQETTESTGETYPWEAEFNEKDFVKFNVTAPKGEKITTWKEGSMFGTERRYLCQYPNGDIMDEYYYPSGNASHCYTWYADGSYSESHHLDDGYTDLEKKMTYSGTTIYQKDIYADGSWNETHCDKNGTVTYAASLDTEGTYWEYYLFEDGTSRDVSDNPNTGEHSESEYYANGNTKKWISDDPEAGTYSESEYYENGNVERSVYKDSATEYCSEQEYFESGNLKHSKNQSPESTMEERYDEEGYRTYFYSKGNGWEIELTADETGKLVKVSENGTVYEGAAIPAHYASDYNFCG